jgi:hypothetical protein
MGNSPTPPGLLERILREVDKRIAQFARSGFLRNATITEGGITIKGGFLQLFVDKLTTKPTVYVGGVTPALPDGTLQPGLIVSRQDGTTAMALYDPTPDPSTPDGFQQFLAIYNRAGDIIVSDDTDSGTGLARPYVPIGLQRANVVEMPKTASASFVDLELGDFYRQHPKAIALVNAGCDTSGTTGEVQVLVDNAVVGTTGPLAFAVGVHVIGPFAVPGAHMSSHRIKVQAKRTAGTGNVCASTSVLGVQS